MVDRIYARRPAGVYVKEWRERFGLSQAQLALRMDASPSKLSKMETGQQRWDDSWLSAAAEALNLEPATLFRHPDAPTMEDLIRMLPDAEIFADTVRAATPEQRKQIVEVAKALVNVKLAS